MMLISTARSGPIVPDDTGGLCEGRYIPMVL